MKIAKENPLLVIDGCALIRQDQRESVRFYTPPLDRQPKISRDGKNSALTLQYAPVTGSYGLAWEGDDSEVREWLSDNLERDFALFIGIGATDKACRDSQSM